MRSGGLVRCARAVPRGRGGARGVQHPGPDRHDQPAVLGHRDEVLGRDVAALRVVPAQQRLRTDDRAIGQRDLGLEVDAELVLGQAAAQVGLQRHAVARALTEVFGVELVARATAGLGGEQRGVGLLHQGVRVGIGGGRAGGVAHGDADAGRDEDVVAVDAAQRRQRFDQAQRDPVQLRVVDAVVDQHGEFVAAEPRDRVLAAQAGAQALRHHHQQPVTRGVAERVVDVLEVVQVEHQHGLHRPLVQPLREAGAVDQPGQHVLERQRVQLALRGLEFGDVLGGGQRVDERALGVVGEALHHAQVAQPERPLDRAVEAQLRQALPHGRARQAKHPGAFRFEDAVPDRARVRHRVAVEAELAPRFGRQRGHVGGGIPDHVAHLPHLLGVFRAGPPAGPGHSGRRTAPPWPG